jgi:hypothetical protein
MHSLEHYNVQQTQSSVTIWWTLFLWVKVRYWSAAAGFNMCDLLYLIALFNLDASVSLSLSIRCRHFNHNFDTYETRYFMYSCTYSYGVVDKFHKHNCNANSLLVVSMYLSNSSVVRHVSRPLLVATICETSTTPNISSKASVLVLCRPIES